MSKDIPKEYKKGYLDIEPDPSYQTQDEKWEKSMQFDGLLEDTDEFGDKTIHGFLGRRRG